MWGLPNPKNRQYLQIYAQSAKAGNASARLRPRDRYDTGCPIRWRKHKTLCRRKRERGLEMAATLYATESR